MKSYKSLTVEHKATGAKVPVIVVQDNPIKYTENLKNRKVFTIDMLSIRWNKNVEQCAEMLQKFQVPAYLHRSRMSDEPEVNLSNAIHAALFFDEYIFAIEKKIGLAHKKIKSQPLENLLKRNENGT